MLLRLLQVQTARPLENYSFCVLRPSMLMLILMLLLILGIDSKDPGADQADGIVLNILN